MRFQSEFNRGEQEEVAGWNHKNRRMENDSHVIGSLWNNDRYVDRCLDIIISLIAPFDSNISLKAQSYKNVNPKTHTKKKNERILYWKWLDFYKDQHWYDARFGTAWILINSSRTHLFCLRIIIINSLSMLMILVIKLVASQV